MTEHSIHCRVALTPEGWREDLIVWLDEHGMIFDIESGKPGDADISLGGHVIPGMPNLHSHAFQRQMAGLGGAWSETGDSFWTWRDTMYRLAGRISPAQMESVSAMVQAEMLEAGYTSCAEFHYLHHRQDGAEYAFIAEMSARLLAAAKTSGIAMTLLPVLYCRSGFGEAGVSPGQARFHNTPVRFLDLFDACRELIEGHPLHRLGVAPHSLRAVSPEQLDQVLAAVSGQVSSVHIHIAEQPAEVADCLSHLGQRPLRWLLEHHDIDGRWCLVHATHIDRAEIRKASASGAVAGLCPTTEADLGDGFFETEAWIEAGGRFGIGSDSNLRVCPAEELRLLENESRLRSGQRNVLSRNGLGPGRCLFEQAVQGGAQALGQPIGRIAPGFRADLLELDDRHYLVAGRQCDEVLDTWLFAGDRSMIRSVRVAGNLLASNGRHRSREEIEAGFKAVMMEFAA